MYYFRLFLFLCVFIFCSADEDAVPTSDKDLHEGSGAMEFIDCSEVQQKGHRSGAYDIRPIGSPNKYNVYCNFDFDGQPWTVLQYRFNGDLDFHRDLQGYSEGFGNALGENWAGLEFMHQVTNTNDYELYIELTDFDNEKRYANYKIFSIDSKENGYRLNIGNYSGTAGDALMVHNTKKFSTYDEDYTTYDYSFHGAWWYSSDTVECNLNGKYLYGKTDVDGRGIFWRTWRGYKYSLKDSRIMIKPLITVDEPIETYTYRSNYTWLEDRLNLQWEKTEELFLNVQTTLHQIVEQNLAYSKMLKTLLNRTNVVYPEDCSNITGCCSGQYKIQPVGVKEPFDVYCDFSVPGQRWTVFQRRFDGNLNFYKKFDDYKYGFGDLGGEHWLGLEKLYQIQKGGNYELYIRITDFDNAEKIIRYGNFSITDGNDGYRLKVSDFSAQTGDSLKYHNGMQFSTYDIDRDHDGRNCAVSLKSAWWFRDCQASLTIFSNLNGFYGRGPVQTEGLGIIWAGWRGSRYSLKTSKMMIRRKI